MTNCRLKLREHAYFRIFPPCREIPELTQCKILERLAIDTSGLNYRLKALIDNAWVKVHNFIQITKKFDSMYIPTLQDLTANAALASRFLQHKLIKCQALQDENNTIQIIDGVCLAPRIGSLYNNKPSKPVKKTVVGIYRLIMKPDSNKYRTSAIQAVMMHNAKGIG